MSPAPQEDRVVNALRHRPHPPLRPPVLAGGDISYLVVELAVGRMLLATRTDGALVLSAFAPDEATVDAQLERIARRVSPRVLRGGRDPDRVRAQLEEYLAGRRHDFDLPVDPVLTTEFQRTVLTRLGDRVGYGSTTSYGRLAAGIGHPRAARAVGTALGANPLCVVLPCHRVVSASGALSGYAGGAEAKRLLLDLEGGTRRRGGR